MALHELTTRYRIFHEEPVELGMVARTEWPDYEELRGVGDTRLYLYSEARGLLAVSTESIQRYRRLEGMPEMKPLNGCVLLFPYARLGDVAEAIKAKKKQQVSPERREWLRAHMLRVRKTQNKPADTGLKTDDREQA